MGALGAVCCRIVGVDLVEGILAWLAIWGFASAGRMGILGAVCDLVLSGDWCRERIQSDAILELLGLWRE